MALVQILKTVKAPKFNRQLHKGLSGYLDESEDLDRDASLHIYLFPPEAYPPRRVCNPDLHSRSSCSYFSYPKMSWLEIVLVLGMVLGIIILRKVGSGQQLWWPKCSSPPFESTSISCHDLSITTTRSIIQTSFWAQFRVLKNGKAFLVVKRNHHQFGTERTFRRQNESVCEPCIDADSLFLNRFEIGKNQKFERMWETGIQ